MVDQERVAPQLEKGWILRGKDGSKEISVPKRMGTMEV